MISSRALAFELTQGAILDVVVVYVNKGGKCCSSSSSFWEALPAMISFPWDESKSGLGSWNEETMPYRTYWFSSPLVKSYKHTAPHKATDFVVCVYSGPKETGLKQAKQAAELLRKDSFQRVCILQDPLEKFLEVLEANKPEVEGKLPPLETFKLPLLSPHAVYAIGQSKQGAPTPLKVRQNTVVVDLRRSDETERFGQLPHSLHWDVSDLCGALASGQFQHKVLGHAGLSTEDTKQVSVVLNCRTNRRALWASILIQEAQKSTLSTLINPVLASEGILGYAKVDERVKPHAHYELDNEVPEPLPTEHETYDMDAAKTQLGHAGMLA